MDQKYSQTDNVRTALPSCLEVSWCLFYQWASGKAHGFVVTACVRIWINVLPSTCNAGCITRLQIISECCVAVWP